MKKLSELDILKNIGVSSNCSTIRKYCMNNCIYFIVLVELDTIDETNHIEFTIDAGIVEEGNSKCITIISNYINIIDNKSVPKLVEIDDYSILINFIKPFEQELFKEETINYVTH